MRIFQGLKQKLEKGLETTSQQSKKMVQISRLTLLIRGKREEEKQLLQKLGESVYERWQGSGELSMTDRAHSLLTNLEENKGSIKELERQIGRLKSEEQQAIQPKKSLSLPVEEEKLEIPAEVDWDSWEGQAIYLCPQCSNPVTETMKVCPYCDYKIYG